MNPEDEDKEEEFFTSATPVFQVSFQDLTAVSVPGMRIRNRLDLLIFCPPVPGTAASIDAVEFKLSCHSHSGSYL